MRSGVVTLEPVNLGDITIEQIIRDMGNHEAVAGSVLALSCNRLDPRCCGESAMVEDVEALEPCRRTSPNNHIISNSSPRDGEPKIQRVREGRVDEEAGNDLANQTVGAECAPLAFAYSKIEGFATSKR